MRRHSIKSLQCTNFIFGDQKFQGELRQRKKKQLTVSEVDVFGDLVPSSVVKVADLFLVLHHICWLASLLVLHCNVVLDGLKILPVLGTKEGSCESTTSKDLHMVNF